MRGDEKTVFSERIVRDILDDINNGVLKPGDKLPGEKQLLEIYKLSRGSVREALRTLQIMNVINIHQGKGSFVASLDTGSLIQHLDFVIKLDETNFDDLFDTRQILEPEIAAMAAQRATGEEIAAMREQIRQDYHVDIFLHETIVKATKNPFLIRFMTSIYHLGELSRKKTMKVPGLVDKVHDQHVALVEAIESHDPQRARKCMKDHLDFVITSYRNHVRKEKEADNV